MHNKPFILSLVLFASFGLLMTNATAQTIKYRSNIEGSSVVIPNEQQINAAKTLRDRILADGAVQMTPAEARQHLAGNTQQWSNGGAHYQADGRLDFIWEGDLFNDYSWRVRRNGLVCIDNPEGFTTSCSLYFNYQGTVWTVVTEEFGEQKDFFGGPDTILVGKQLDDLEPWDPSLSGN
ncbi:MAG: hypothetical protein QNJ69_06055 [Gammaproteobacteria bacterium]|nr:hypothetical protein [Gammaproteobacteria bacterium]